MASLQDQFEQASRDAQNLPTRPVSGPAPGLFDFKASAKYDAWSKLEGTSQDSARKKYIDLIKSLKA